MNFSDYGKRNTTNSADILNSLSPEMRERILQEATGNININIGNQKDGFKQRTLGVDIKNATQNMSEEEQKFLESNQEYTNLMSYFMATLNTYIQNQYLELFLNTEEGSKIGENLLDNIKKLRSQYSKDKDKIIEENDPDIINFIKNKNKSSTGNKNKEV